MHALVVYESMWGNTEQVARAIAQGIAEAAPSTWSTSPTRPRSRAPRCR